MIPKIEQNLRTVVNHIKRIMPVSGIYLFGSYAYGTPTSNSDLDIMVICPNRSQRKVDLMSDVQRAIYHEVDIPVDILINYEDEFKERSQNHLTLEYEVANKGVELSNVISLDRENLWADVGIRSYNM